GGSMAAQAVKSLDRDPATDIILLVSKPPDPDTARTVVQAAGATPIVVALVGMRAGTEIPGAAGVASTLEGGVLKTLAALGHPAPRAGGGGGSRGRGRARGVGPPPPNGARALLGGNAVLRGAHGVGTVAGPGVVQHAAGQTVPDPGPSR